MTHDAIGKAYGSRLLGDWLRKRRRQLGLTQEELAARTACTREAISKIELAERRPSLQVARMLAEALGIPEEERARFMHLARNGSVDAYWPDRQKKSNLPAPLTPFVGREAELKSLKEHMLSEGIRLLTLTGPPGVGKTRLALELARDLTDFFSDGAHLVRLAALSTAASVPAALVESLGLHPAQGRSPSAVLSVHLRRRHLLLVLDNFEQVVDAGPQISELLEECPQLKVLVTSREPLELYPEHLFRVEPLELPSEEQVWAVASELLLRYSSVALFHLRARAANLNFVPDVTASRKIAGMCRRLDGVPLAIEIVAAQMYRFSLSDLYDQVGKHLALASPGARDLPARHSTLREAIAWSYTLLDDAEQALFRSMAVFAGGATLNAIETICDSGSGDEDSAPSKTVSALLASLVRKSLLVEEVEIGSPTRFYMLNVIREFAFEEMRAHREAEEVAQRHTLYFAQVAERAWKHLPGPEQSSWLKLLASEHNNVRAALAWSLEHRHAELALQMCADLSYFWGVHGHHKEALSWIDKALDTKSANHLRGLGSDTLGAPGASPVEAARVKFVQARVLFAKAARLGWERRYDESNSLLRESLGLFHEVGDKEWSAEVLDELGLNHARTQEYEAAGRLYLESLALFREIGYLPGVATVLNNLGGLSRLQDDYHQAIAWHGESRELQVRLGNNRGAYISSVNLADDYSMQGDMTTASTLLRQAIREIQDFGDPYWLAASLCEFARLAAWLGHHERAVRLAAKSAQITQEVGFPLGPITVAACSTALNSAQRALDEEAFQRAHDEGEALTTEQIIEYALELSYQSP